MWHKISSILILIPLSFLGLVSSQFSSNKANLSTLKSVHVIFRHGAKSPQAHWLPNVTESGSEDWPQGWDQLTNKGKSQAHEMGIFLRTRYDGFISKTYHPKEIYIQSSDYERTIQSAQTALLAMYPMIQSSNYDSSQSNLKSWNPEFFWELVPIHTIPKESDNLLEINCPKMTDDWFEILIPCDRTVCRSKVLYNFYETNREMMNKIALHAGVPGMSNAIQVYMFEENVLLMAEDNRKLDDWMIELLNTPAFHQIAPTYFTIAHSVPDWIKLRTGPFWNEFISHIESPNNQAKLQLYSGHDKNIVDVLKSLDLWNNLMPQFSSVLIFELHQVESNEPFIQIFYKNDSSLEPLYLEMPQCKNPCTLTQFKQLVSKYKVTDSEWKEGCGLMASPTYKSPFQGPGFIILSILVGVLVISAILGLYLECSDNKYAHAYGRRKQYTKI